MAFRLIDQPWLLFYLRMLKYLGVDVLDDSPCNIFKRYYRFFLTCLSPAVLLFIVTVVNREKGENMEAILLDFRMALVFAQDIMTILILASNKEKIRKILIGIEETGLLLQNNNNDDNDRKRQICETFTKNRNSYNKKYFIAEFGILFPANSFLLILINLYKYHAHPGSKFVCVLDSCKQWKTKNIYVYLVFSVYEAMTCIVFHGFVHSGFIVIMGTILYSMCTMMRLLQVDLERVFDNKRKRLNHAEISDLNLIVKNHQRLLILTRDINETFGTNLFISLGFVGPVLCISLYSAAVMDTLHISSWCFGFLNLFLFCWPGQMFIDASIDLAKAVYACPWYSGNIKTAKIMMIFLMRSQALTKISPLGYFNLDFNLLATILQSSWSLFSLLKRVS